MLFEFWKCFISHDLFQNILQQKKYFPKFETLYQS